MDNKKIRFKKYQKITGNYIKKIYYKNHSYGIVIADEVGLGKTYEVLYFLKKLFNKSKNKKVLIVLPSKDIFSHWIAIIDKLFKNDKFWQKQIKGNLCEEKYNSKRKYKYLDFLNLKKQRNLKKLKVLIMTKNDLISIKKPKNLSKKKWKKIKERLKFYKAKIKKIKKFSPSIVIFDEFHNFKKLLDTKLAEEEKKEERKEKRKSIAIYIKEILEFLKGRHKFKIYISATPFKPLVKPKIENVDIVSPVLNNLIYKYKNDNETKEYLNDYFKNIIELRENYQRENSQNEEFKSIIKKIKSIKIELEKRLKKYIIENRRKIDTHRLKDEKCFENGKVSLDEDFMYNYLKLHEEIYKYRKKHKKLNILMAEQILTSGKKTLNYKFNMLKTCRELNMLQFEVKKHEKLEKLRKIIKNIIKEPDIFVNHTKTEKFIVFCYFKASPMELKEEIINELNKVYKFNKKTVKKINKKKLKNILEENIKKIKILKKLKLIRKNDLIDILTSYFLNENVYKILKVKYKFKSYLKLFNKEFLNNFINYFIDGLKKAGDPNVIETLKNKARDLEIIHIYGQAHGGGKNKKLRENYNMELRSLFNFPLLPLGLITTNIGAEGIDFHKYCRNVIHYDIWWMPSRMEQRVGRIDRVNSYVNSLREKQKKKCKNLLDGVEFEIKNEYKNSDEYKIIQYYMAIEGTVDEYIWERFQERKIWTSLLGGGIFNMEKFFKGIAKKPSEEEIKQLQLNELRLNLAPN